jgi:ferredoxin
VRLLKQLHKWIGLLAGIQVLLWLVSGLVISLLDPAKVSGRQWASATATKPQVQYASELLEPAELPAAYLEEATALDLGSRQGRPVYRISYADGEALVDATDGSVITTGKAEATELARQDFTGDGAIASVERGVAPDLETRNRHGDYWKVNFSDKANTSIYISVATGDILERRNAFWRVRDFFWMLHIMDYSGRENFNNALVIGMALIAVWLGISGFLLLFGSFTRHDFFFLKLSGKSEHAVITLHDPDSATQRVVSLRKGSNLFLSLATRDIGLPSICGGGGECGKCRVKFESSGIPEANEIEIGLIPGRLREQGYRLACQQTVVKDVALHLPVGTLANNQ